jgi:hypothetical protein
MAKTIAYTAKPPTTAKAAREAWNYFMRHHASVKRPIAEMYYAPNYRYNGPHWVCVLAILEDDTQRWAFNENDVTWAYPTSHFK